jgi:hypothetical protein
MPLPFREDDDPGRPGVAAYMRVIRENDAHAWAAGLLVVNRIGEPVELIHLRLTVPLSSLCQGRLTDHACALLLRGLLERCQSVPDRVHFRPDEINEAVLRERIILDVPITAIASDYDDRGPDRDGIIKSRDTDALLRLENAIAAIAAAAMP